MITTETAICHNPQNSSTQIPTFLRQLGYEHTFCHNVSTKILLILIFS